MADTLVNNTFFIIFQTVFSSGNQITKGNDKIGFQLQGFLIPLMAQLNIHRIQIIFGIGCQPYHLPMQRSHKGKIFALRIADHNIVLCHQKAG